jgi:flagellar assembly factor FliW
MEVNTLFGRQDVDPDTVLEFPNGLPGFENLRRFKLFHEEGKGTIFWLQSLDDPEIQLPVTDPERFRVRYQITLQDDEVATLRLADDKDAMVMLILYRDDTGGAVASGGPIKANFMSPLVINARERLGMQKLLTQMDGYVNIQAE